MVASTGLGTAVLALGVEAEDRAVSFTLARLDHADRRILQEGCSALPFLGTLARRNKPM
jgi:hypothetical protein